MGLEDVSLLPRFDGTPEKLRLFTLNFKRYLKSTVPGSEKVLEGEEATTEEQRDHVHLSLLLALEKCEETVALVVRGHDDPTSAWRALNDFYRHANDEGKKSEYLSEFVESATWRDDDTQDSYGKRVLSAYEKMKAVYDMCEEMTKETATAWVLFALFHSSKPKDFAAELKTPPAKVNEMVMKVLHATAPRSTTALQEPLPDRVYRMSAKRRTPEGRRGRQQRQKSVCKWCRKYGYHAESECFENPDNMGDLEHHQQQHQGRSSRRAPQAVPTQRHRTPVAARLEPRHVSLKAVHGPGHMPPASAIGVDSQSSVHIISSKSLFTNIRRLHAPVRVQGVGGEVSVTHAGSVLLRISTTDDSEVLLTLHDVMFLPDFGFNILSAGALVDNGIVATLSKDDSSLLLPSGASVPLERVGDNTFFFHVNNERPALQRCHAVHSLRTWHRRLGHRAVSTVRKALQEQSISFHEEESDDSIRGDGSDTAACEECMPFKAVRKTISKRAKGHDAPPGAILHLDLLGPFPASVHGSKYALVLVDEHTRFVELTFLKRKSEVCDALRRFLQATSLPVERGTLIQTDSDPVFTSRAFVVTARELGLRMRYSPPYVHEHNGLVERSIRTIKESAAAMLHAAEVPAAERSKFWSAALDHAAWVYNLMPHSKLKGSPYQALFQRPPPLDQLHVFGCRAFIYDHVRTDKAPAFPRRALEGIYLGWDRSCNAHRIFVTATQCVRSSIHVDFVERPRRAPQGGAFPESPLADPRDAPTARDDHPWVATITATSGPDEAQPSPTANVASEEAATPGTSNSTAPPIPCDSGEQAKQPTTGDDNSTSTDDAPTLDDTDILCMKTTLMPNAMVQVSQAKPPPVPTSWRQAMASPDKDKWQDAFTTEWANMVRHDVFDIVDSRHVPLQAKPIPSKLVFAVKHKPDGSTLHKVRFVCCGNRQTDDTYEDVFSPTTRFEALRVFLAVTAHRHMQLCQFDVSAAFLHADLDVDNVFVRPPAAANLPAGSLLKLRKSLYGLRQAPKLWYASVWRTISASGFKRLRSDACVFAKADLSALVCVHVDDFLVAATSDEAMRDAEAMLASCYELKNLGAPKKYLSIAIDYNRAAGTMTLSQEEYVQALLKQHGLQDCNAKATPLPAKIKLVPAETAEIDVGEYQSIIGSLLYLAVSTRPDISYATSVLSRFIQQPAKQHLHAARHVLKYLKGTAALGLQFTAAARLRLTGYSDASHMSDPSTSKGHGGYCFTVAGGPVTWLSKRLPLLTTSSAETEYVAAARAAQAAIYVRQLLAELGFDLEPTPLFMDSQSAMCIANNPVVKGGSKHIRLRFHVLRELIADGTIAVKYEPGKTLLADMLTKSLPRPALETCREQVLHAR